MSHSLLRALLIACISAMFVTTGAPQNRASPENAQGSASQADPDRSSFLIARPELNNPFFQQSIVMMLPVLDKEIVVGLIVNKPIKITLSEVFPKITVFNDRTDTVYFGGPVDVKTPEVLFRSTKSFKQAFHLTNNLYVSFDPSLIEAILKKQKKEVSEFRLFIGRAQWDPDQLAGEMEAGAWYGTKEENSVIFSADQDLWKTLIGQLEPGMLV